MTWLWSETLVRVIASTWKTTGITPELEKAITKVCLYKRKENVNRILNTLINRSIMSKALCHKVYLKKTNIKSMLGTEILRHCGDRQMMGQAVAVLFTSQGCSDLKKWVNAGNLTLEVVKLFTYTGLLGLAWIRNCSSWMMILDSIMQKWYMLMLYINRAGFPFVLDWFWIFMLIRVYLFLYIQFAFALASEMKLWIN